MDWLTSCGRCAVLAHVLLVTTVNFLVDAANDNGLFESDLNIVRICAGSPTIVSKRQLLFGDSFQLDIRFQFKGYSKYGLLLHLGDSQEYVDIVLDNQVLQVKIKFNNDIQVEELVVDSRVLNVALANGLWHSVEFSRQNENFRLILDGQSVVAAAPFARNQPLALAGVVSFGQLAHHKLLTPFCGCIQNASINEAFAVEFLEPDQLVNNCDDLTLGTELISTRFDGDQSVICYDVNRHVNSTFYRHNMSIALDFLPQTSNSLLAFLPGQLHSDHFVLLGLSDGYVQAIAMRDQLSVWYLLSPQIVEPSVWHNVRLDLTETEISLQLDGRPTRVYNGGGFDLVLSQSLYIGNAGMDRSLSNSIHAFLGMRPLAGCARNVQFNAYKMYPYDIVALRSINFADCDKASPLSSNCVSSNSCEYAPNMLGDNFDKHMLKDTYAVNPLHPGYRNQSGLTASQALTINAPSVEEGKSVRLEWYHLNPRLGNLTWYGMTPEDMYYWITAPMPKYGKVVVKREGTHEIVGHFTFQDLHSGNVNYTHDGSETTSDTINLEVEFRVNLRHVDSQTMLLPTAWQGRLPFALPVIITPKDDPPNLTFPKGNIIQLARQSRLTLTQDYVLVKDNDTPPNAVVINVNSNPKIVRFESVRAVGVPIFSFTHEDLINEQVVLVHVGEAADSVQIRVNDDNTQSEIATLDVRPYQLDLQMERNTGIRVLHGLSEYITNANLSFVTNAQDQQKTVDVQYRIVRMAQHGFVQVLMDNEWWIAETFNQSQINSNRIRYQHSKTERPASDMFRFQVSSLNTTAPTIYDFTITFTPMSVRWIRLQEFLLNDTEQSFIVHDNIYAVTFPRMTQPQHIQYHVVAPPERGYLYKVIAENRHRRLGAESNFTQADIDNNKIYYSLHERHYDYLTDRFEFRVFTPSVNSPTSGFFDIAFLPGNHYIQLTNKTLYVHEGEVATISKELFWVETKDHQNFNFTVRSGPQHGKLALVGAAPQSFANSFTSHDIYANNVQYQHDDSEFVQDEMYIIARPNRDAAASFLEIPFWFRFKIVLRNDNPPRPTTLNSAGQLQLFVVKNSDKIILPQELNFHDADIDFDSANLRYDVPEYNADAGFYFSHVPSVAINTFIQRNIDNHEILLRHYGRYDSFTLDFAVSDGKFTANHTLLVNGSAPFLREIRNYRLDVRVNGSATITNNVLAYLTNINIEPKRLIFRITLPPAHGKLILRPNTTVDRPSRADSPIDRFTQADLLEKRLFYQHNGAKDHTSDFFAFTVYAKDQLESSAKFGITIVPEESSSLYLARNQMLIVPLRGIAPLTSDHLRAQHVSLGPGSIRYTVMQGPMHGRLIQDSRAGLRTVGGSDVHLSTFTQLDIDQRVIQYLHISGTAMVEDFVLFSINTTEGSSLSNVRLDVRVVENEVTLWISKNMTVHAKDRQSLTQVIEARSSYYSDPAFIYFVLDAPTRGFIELMTDDTLQFGERITQFSSQDLEQGKVSYVHEGGSGWDDQFTITAKLSQEAVQSDSRVVYVKIVQQNLREPELVTNMPLETWRREITALSSENLAFSDMDTPASEIMYKTSNTQNGYLAMRNDPTVPVHEFSQLDLNNKQVVFVLRGEESQTGGFSFLVTDGAHRTRTYHFEVKASRLDFTLEANNPLVTAPNFVATISSSDHLRVSVSNARPRQILYRIIRHPKKGHIEVGGVASDSFTQEDLNLARVTYNQTEPILQWFAKDAFWFQIAVNITVGNEPLVQKMEENQFRITISYAAVSKDSLSNYIISHPVHLKSGHSVVLDTNHLDLTPLSLITSNRLVVHVTKLPLFGVLEFRGRNMSHPFDFPQEALDNRHLIYHHNAAFPAVEQDTATLLVYPQGQADRVYDRQNLQLQTALHFQIQPSRDDSALRKTLLDKPIKMVRGYVYNVTKNDFLLPDLSRAHPEAITYHVFKGPQNAEFMLAGVPQSQFTQADINGGRVQLQPLGSDSRSSLTVAVSGIGYEQLLYEVAVLVEPLYVTFVNHTAVRYLQLSARSGSININRSHLAVDTNGLRNDVHYLVETAPSHGHLFKDNSRQPIFQFTQQDIDDNRIIYELINMDHGIDRFGFKVYNARDVASLRQTFTADSLTIEALPQVQQQAAYVAPGGSLFITSNMLDASELSALSDRPLMFLIHKPPEYGVFIKHPTSPLRRRRGRKFRQRLILKRAHLRQRKRANNILANETVTAFSFDDIRDKRIEYVVTKDTNSEQEVKDSFVYELTAGGFVPPARGTFYIYISPELLHARTPRPTEPPTSEKPPKQATLPGPTFPLMKGDHIIPIAVGVALCVLAGFFVVVCKVRISMKRQARLTKKVPLEPPYEKAQFTCTATESRQPDLITPPVTVPEHRNGVDLLHHEKSATLRPKTRQRAHGHGSYSSEKPSQTMSLTRDAQAVKGPRPSSFYVVPSSPIPSRGSGMTHISASYHSDGSTGAVHHKLVTFEAGKPEIISTIPLCRVTPLAPGSTCSSSSDDYGRFAFQYSSSASDQDGRLNTDHLDRRRKMLRTSAGSGTPVRQMKLKDNQYWV